MGVIHMSKKLINYKAKIDRHNMLAGEFDRGYLDFPTIRHFYDKHCFKPKYALNSYKLCNSWKAIVDNIGEIEKRGITPSEIRNIQLGMNMPVLSFGQHCVFFTGKSDLDAVISFLGSNIFRLIKSCVLEEIFSCDNLNTLLIGNTIYKRSQDNFRETVYDLDTSNGAYLDSSFLALQDIKILSLLEKVVCSEFYYDLFLYITDPENDEIDIETVESLKSNIGEFWVNKLREFVQDPIKFFDDNLAHFVIGKSSLAISPDGDLQSLFEFEKAMGYNKIEEDPESAYNKYYNILKRDKSLEIHGYEIFWNELDALG